MKDLLISHISDIDGVSPVILLKLCKVNFDYELKEINELEEYLNELLNMDLSVYENIYITDLTVPESFYKKIENNEYKNKFKVFDHHQTHMYASEIENVTIDTKECGTSLFYKYLKNKYNLNKNIIKEYVEHVKNLDIWLWQEKNDILAKQLGDLFGIYGREKYIEKMYLKLKKKRSFKLDKLEQEILKLEQEKIDRYVDKKNKELIVIDYQNYKAGLVFCERYKSEIGNKLSSIHPELAFIIMINLSGGISLRTTKEIDLSLIAESLGGGGHKKACGAPINKEDKENLIKNIFKGCVINDY